MRHRGQVREVQLRLASRRLTEDVLRPATRSTMHITHTMRETRTEFDRIRRVFEQLWVTAAHGRCGLCRRPVKGPWQLRKHLRTFHGIGRG